MTAESPSAVRFFAGEHPHQPRNLRAKLEQRCEQLIVQVGGGYASDWADYKERIGTIKGLIEGIEICKEVEKELTGEG